MSGPFLGPDVKDLGAAWIDPSARLFGDVEIHPGASVWCNVVVRAESDRVVIGPRANIQDFVMIHVGAGTGDLRRGRLLDHPSRDPARLRDR